MPRFTPEHDLFRASLRGFLEREVLPYIDAWEAARRMPARSLFRRLGEEGYLGLTYPEADGGADLDLWYKVVWLEELGRLPAGGVSMTITLQSDICTPALVAHGSPYIRERFLRPAVRGESIGALAVTEEEAGSDLTALATTAVDDGDAWVVDGCKSYITNGSLADFVVVLCRTDDRGGAAGMTLLVVPTDAEGFEAHDAYPDKLGNLCCDHARLTFDGVRVPKANTLGPVGAGWTIQMELFRAERLMEALLLQAQCRYVLDHALDFARTRRVMDRPLIEHQAIGFGLVELDTEVELLRAYTHHAVDLTIAGQDPTRAVTRAKMKAGRLVRRVLDECLHLLGARGYMHGHPVARLMRDLRAAALTGGSIEVMQHILVRLLADDTAPRSGR